MYTYSFTNFGNTCSLNAIFIKDIEENKYLFIGKRIAVIVYNQQKTYTVLNDGDHNIINLIVGVISKLKRNIEIVLNNTETKS